MTRADSKLTTQQTGWDYAPSLPLEVIESILAYIPPSDTSQSTLCACTLISKAWYSAAIIRLYANPRISGKNYDPFVTSVCPSINAHIRSNGLGELVRILDLSKLVHHSSKSKTARLLGRVKSGVKEFVAPQASFGLVERYSQGARQEPDIGMY